MKREYTQKQPIDKNVGKTIVGYVREYDLDTLYGINIPVYQDLKHTTYRDDGEAGAAYEVQLKIVRRV